MRKEGFSTSANGSSDENSPHISIYDLRQNFAIILINKSTHKAPVVVMTYNSKYDCVISADTSGMVEYWMPKEGFWRPKDVFDLKSATDLYDFRKVDLFAVHHLFRQNRHLVA